MLYVPPSGSTDANAPYIGKNVAAGTQGSKVPPNAVEHPQREILAILAAAQLAGMPAPTATDLTQMLKAVRSGLLNYFVGTGSADAVAITPTPAYIALVPGMIFRAKIPGTGSNTSTTPTLGINSLSAPILRNDGSAPAAGDLVGGRVVTFQIDDALSARVVGLLAKEAQGRVVDQLIWAAAGTYAVPNVPGANFIGFEGWGAGGAGGSAPPTSGTNMGLGAPGSGGGTVVRLIRDGWKGATFGVGGGGQPVASAAGGNGGPTYFSSLCLAYGGIGGPIANPSPAGIGVGGQGSPNPTGGTQGQSNGSPGGVSLGINANAGAFGAQGGDGVFGGGGPASPSNTNGNPGRGPAAGGSGTATTNGFPTSPLGGAGGDGWVRITFYA